jgi:hypothetical protein
MVGPSDGPGEESFDVMVCTPRWLSRIAHDQGPLIRRHYLIVDRMELPRILSFLEGEVERLEEPTWPELPAKLARLGKWEFEDYMPR